MTCKSFLLLGSSLMAMCATGGGAQAMMLQADTGPAEAEESQTIDRIVVTARRRDESIQDVPVAVSVADRERLENNLATDLTKVAEVAPQVIIGNQTTGTGAIMGIRGISSTSADPGLDQSVAIAIDGVILSRGRVISMAMLDLQQVEVLQGPQALFFGKNSPAGVVSLRSAAPTSTFEGYVRGGHEFEANETYFEGAVSGPLTDTLDARFSFRSSRMDGWIENVAEPVEDPLHPGVILPGEVSGGTQPDSEDNVARLSLSWEPTADFSLDFRLLGAETDRNAMNAYAEPFCTNGVTTPTVFGTIPLPYADCEANQRKAESALAPEYSANYTYGNNGVPYYTSDAILGSLTMNREFGNITLTSTTGYFNQEFSGTNNADYTPFALIWSAQHEEYELWSQEFRVNSNFDSPLNFSAGVYYETSERHFGNFPDILHAGLNVEANNYTTFETLADAETETLSAFGQLRWDISPDLELAVGARYSEDTKSQDAYNRTVGVTGMNLLPAGEVLSSRFEGDNLSPEASLRWRFTPGSSVYFAYKTGYKAGAISNGAILYATSTPDSLVIDEEVAEGFEVGYRADLFDSSLRLSVTAYTYDFDDLQLGTFDATTTSFTIQNAAAARTEGVQASFDWYATRDLTIMGSLGYNEARYTSFADAPCYTGQTEAQGCVGGVQDLTGDPLTRAPDLTANIGANYNVVFGEGWGLDTTVDASYSSEYQSAPDGDPGGMQEEFWRLNAAFHLTPPSDAFRLSLIGRNLTDSYYIISTSGRPLGGPNEYIGVFNRPREVVLQAEYRF